jgi:hypothetical protein
MLNKEYKGNLSTGNLDPIVHGRFRGGCYEKNGTLNGAYTRELLSVVKKLIQVKNGELKVVELLDPEALLLLTHTENNDNNRIMRKNQRNQLNRASIEKIDETDCNMIKSFLINTYGTLYGKISPLLNEAMDLWFKIYRKRVKLVETSKKSFKSFMCDSKGQIDSINTNSFFEALEMLNLKFDNLKQDMKRTVKDTIQSTLNIVSKPLKKGKNIINSTVKSARRDDKLEKALRIIDNVMKFNEHGFTEKEYHNSLVKLTGQGDPRTVRSDLAMLKAVNKVKKLRNSAHGTEKYQFTNNDQYHKYNSDLAKNRFFEDFKKAFHDEDALTVNDLNEFIFKKYELYDGKSQHIYLKWLLADGLVNRHDVNPLLLFIQK